MVVTNKRVDVLTDWSSDQPSLSLMFFIRYFISPECIEYIHDTRLYTERERTDTDTEE